MFAKQLFANNAVSLLAAPISATDTTLSVIPGTGNLYPSPGANQYFLVTLEDQAGLNREIVCVTSRTGDTFTINRAQEGTAARAWNSDANTDTLVDHRVTAASLQRLDNTYSNSSRPTLTSVKEAIDFLLTFNFTVDAPFTINTTDTNTIITLTVNYIPNTTIVNVGGLRQKRGVDFLETSPNTLTLQYVLTQPQIDAGQNIVVDYVGS